MLVEFVFHVEEESGMQYKNLRICKIIIERIACRTASLSGGRISSFQGGVLQVIFFQRRLKTSEIGRCVVEPVSIL